MFYRHMEDGCSKRFDIETVDFRPQSYNNSNDQHNMRVPTRTSDNQSRQASYSSGGHYSPPPGSSTSRGPHVHDNSLTSVPGTYLERHEYLSHGHSHSHGHGQGAGHEAVWSN